MGNNGFTAYVIIWIVALWLSAVSVFLLKRVSSTSKYWLSVIVDRFTLTVNLTPSEVRRGLAATINPFSRESSAPYAEQWVTTDAFEIDRFAQSRLLYTHGEIWSHPGGALIRVTLRTPGLVLGLLALGVVNPLAISSPTFLALSLGLILPVAAGYYFMCLAEARRAKTFLTNLLNAAGNDAIPAAQPGASYREPILFEAHAELAKAKDGLILTSPRMYSGCYVLLLIGFILGFMGTVMLLLLGPGLVRIIFILVILCVGLVLLYYALVTWFNRTVMTLTRQTLSVCSQPLPVYGNMTIPTAELRQLYPKRVVVLVNKGGGEVVVTYELRAILKNNKHITLFEFNSPEEVLYTKQQMEAWLRLNGYILEESPH